MQIMRQQVLLSSPGLLHEYNYTKLLNGDAIVIPKYLQRKQFNNEHPAQRKFREAAVLHGFKTEIDSDFHDFVCSLSPKAVLFYFYFTLL